MPNLLETNPSFLDYSVKQQHAVTSQPAPQQKDLSPSVESVHLDYGSAPALDPVVDNSPKPAPVHSGHHYHAFLNDTDTDSDYDDHDYNEGASVTGIPPPRSTASVLIQDLQTSCLVPINDESTSTLGTHVTTFTNGTDTTRSHEEPSYFNTAHTVNKGTNGFTQHGLETARTDSTTNTTNSSTLTGNTSLQSQHEPAGGPSDIEKFGYPYSEAIQSPVTPSIIPPRSKRVVTQHPYNEQYQNGYSTQEEDQYITNESGLEDYTPTDQFTSQQHSVRKRLSVANKLKIFGRKPKVSA